jgi:membrane protease subunit HflK
VGDDARGIGRWIAVLLVLWLVFNTFVLVTEQQRGVVLRFGQFARVLQPGPHFKWPWPIERVAKVDATTIRTFNDTVPVLTRDENIVRVEINVQYSVADPQLYLFSSRDAGRVLEQAALSTVREQVGRSTLDTVLGARLGLRRVSGEVQLPPGAGRLRARLHELGAVLAEHHDEHGWTLSLDLAEADAARIVAHAYGEPLRPLLPEGAPAPT